MSDDAAADRVERLLDAIDLIRDDRRAEAVEVLRELIREDKDSEQAWLWMSVAVDSLDQSIVCLDNVLRINPNNGPAAAALYRLREPEMEVEKQRSRLRFRRDMSLISMWLLAIFIVLAVIMTWMVRYGSAA